MKVQILSGFMNKSALWLLAVLVGMIMFSCDKVENLAKDHRLNETSQAFAQTGPGQKPTAIPDVQMKIVPVSALEVHSIGGRDSTWYEGVVRNDPEFNLSFKIPGTVNEINYKTGARLMHESVLATLDSSIQKDVVDKLEASVELAEVEALKARVRLSKVKTANKQGTSSADDLKVARAEVQKAEYNVRIQRNKLKAARIDLGFHEIRVIRRGRITSINVAVGDTVEMGQTVAVMESMMPPEVTVKVPTVFLSRVGIKARARVKLSEEKSRTHNADVIKMGEPSPGPKGTFPVTVRLRRPNSGYKTDMAAKVAFKFDYNQRNKLFLLPHSSVGNDSQGDYVYIIKPDSNNSGVLERRSVKTGNGTAWGQEVIQGLEDGELIVADDIDRLKNGMQIKWK